MSDGFSTTLVNALLGVLASTSPTTYGTIYVGIFTGDPGTAGTSNVSAGSSTRQSFTFNSPSAGSISAASSPSWTNGGTSETITDVGVFTAASAGTFLFSAQLASSKAWNSGDTLQLSTFTVSMPTAS